MYEFLVSTSWQRKILRRWDNCPKCDKVVEFRFVSHSGMHGRLDGRPDGLPPPSDATLFFRKKRNGKEASAPLDRICKANEW